MGILNMKAIFLMMNMKEIENIYIKMMDIIYNNLKMILEMEKKK